MELQTQLFDEGSFWCIWIRQDPEICKFISIRSEDLIRKVCWICGFSTPLIRSLITSSWSCKRSSSMRNHCYIYGSHRIQWYDHLYPADPKICLDKCGPDMRISGHLSGWRSSHPEAANAASRWEFIVKSLDPLRSKDLAFFIQQILRSVWIKGTGWFYPYPPISSVSQRQTAAKAAFWRGNIL
jgi:hypothetical protein